MGSIQNINFQFLFNNIQIFNITLEIGSGAFNPLALAKVIISKKIFLS